MSRNSNVLDVVDIIAKDLVVMTAPESDSVPTRLDDVPCEYPPLGNSGLGVRNHGHQRCFKVRHFKRRALLGHLPRCYGALQ